MLVHIDGKRIVNLDHVALAEFTSEHKATRLVYSDIDGREHSSEYIEPDTLELVLNVPVDSGYSSSVGMSIKVRNDNARDLWRYLENRADIPNLEQDESTTPVDCGGSFESRTPSNGTYSTGIVTQHD